MQTNREVLNEVREQVIRVRNAVKGLGPIANEVPLATEVENLSTAVHNLTMVMDNVCGKLDIEEEPALP